MSATHACNRVLRLWAIGLMVCLGVSIASAQSMAGSTVSTATPIVDTVILRVQSGMNHLRIEPNRLPATIVYTPDTAFGPVPSALMADTLEAEAFFDDCMMGWRWIIPAAEEAAWVTIAAHEDASITVSPTIKTAYNRITEQACDSLIVNGRKLTESGEYAIDTTLQENGDRLITVLELTIHETTYEEITEKTCVQYEGPSGKIYTESGEYRDSTLQANGCYHIALLNLSIHPHCMMYDTIYFCSGLNTQHEETVNDWLVRRYLAYLYESPGDWDYMDGVILATETNRSYVDLHRAEENLRAHYVGKLSPIESIAWSILYADATVYTPIEAGDAPQWLDEGMLALQVQFRCGEIYNNEFPMAIDEIETELMPVKRVENGKVVIVRGGERYTILGIKL